MNAINLPTPAQSPESALARFEAAHPNYAGRVALAIPDTMGPEKSNNAIGDDVAQKSRGMSCDPIWDQEFDQALKASGLEIVADYRGFDTKGA